MLLQILWQAFRIAAIGYLGILLLMLLLEKRLVFHPATADQRWQPAAANMEEAEFQAADGTRLHGWYAAASEPRAVVLFAHGNGGNLSDRRQLLERLRGQLGLSVLLFDYRGYGRSAGSPDEQGILLDARAARRWLAERSGVAEREIVLLGRSLGTGVMVDLAAGEGARGLVLISAYNSLPEVAADKYPWLPVRPLMRTRLDSQAKIARYAGPLLQLHGDCDPVIPWQLGHRLYEASPSPNKTWLLMTGCDHDNIINHQFATALDRWIATLPAE